MQSRDTVLKYLSAELSPSDMQLMNMVVVQPERSEIVFRLPSGIAYLDELYNKIEAVMDSRSLHCRRAERFATVEDLDKILSAVEWLWEKWVPRGFVTMIAGDPGSGKSWQALDLVRMVTAGDPWPLTTERRDPARAIWVEAEASQQLLMERSKTIGVQRSMLNIPMFDDDLLGQPDLFNEHHLEQITNMVVAIKPQMLVLDSLGGSNTKGENKVEEVRPPLAYLAALSRDNNIAVVVVHHLRKLGPNDDMEIAINRVRGSSAISAYCRSMIGVRRLRESVNKVAVFKSNLVARFPLALNVTSEYEGDNIKSMQYAQWQAPAPKRNKKELCAEWVLQQLSANKNGIELHALIELGQAVGYSRGNIYSAKDVLGDQIAVTGTGNKAYWSLSNDIDAAEAVLDSMFATEEM